ncbi:isocitrate lyase/phosphoenolpyruvate mutase family protein [Streptomyces sp. MRC013]|uniref:isocitrate lyase/phosphoenolpyruvate mutase family protein n=1 Tax=Streptomyces sp. MRC013 TaxID=2898276 RepID=UPI0020268A84|nr:isocitrate lyase/phosphoenolpyruvate mutase family protein [Streptomyces sp. MRC013]URM89115.1 isocitrate lyase/phosphoenolpyruvate mutase family protein [Streptomyces sp. MRC013]
MTTSQPSARSSAAQALRAALESPGLARAMGAHNPLSARLAEEVGFDVIWSSGLEISAAAGVPDANILAMPECLEAAAGLANAVDLPVLADCDSGFGNVNNVVHMVRAYESRGLAGVCIEDKRFPKLNSFVEGDQELAPLGDFAGKVRAATETRENLVVVARLEALISGKGMAEALRRAEVYERAGADALLIHSKLSEPDEVFAFREAYTGDLPVVVVPTTYHHVTVGELEERGFAMAIYANHALRSSLRAMRETLGRIMRDGTTRHVEESLASLKEIFDLQRVPQMLEQQARYEELGRDLAEAGR